MIKTPKHINLNIEHQPHASNYQTVEDYLAVAIHDKWCEPSEKDLEEMLATGEIWEVQWYPVNPVGFCVVAAATLERALELACEQS